MAKSGDDVFKESGFKDEQGYGFGGWDVTQSAANILPPVEWAFALHVRGR